MSFSNVELLKWLLDGINAPLPTIEYDGEMKDGCLKVTSTGRTDGTLLLDWAIVLNTAEKMLMRNADKYIVHDVIIDDEFVDDPPHPSKKWMHSNIKVEITFSEVRYR